MPRDFEPATLEALLESAQLLHETLSLEDLLSHLLRSTMGRMMVTRGFLALVEGDITRISVSRGLKTLAPGTPVTETTAQQAGIAHLFRIGTDAVPLGLLGLSKPLNRELEERDRAFLEALLGIAASAINNAKAHDEARALNTRLKHKVLELHTLLDLGQGLTSSIEPAEIVRMLGFTLAGQWLIRKYAIHAWKKGQDPVERKRSMKLDPMEIREHLSSYTTAIRVEDLPQGTARQTLQTHKIQAVIPLISKDKQIGFAALGPCSGQRTLTQSDLEFCSGLAAQAVIALENAWHFKETLEKRKLEKELALAAQIQQALFPGDLPPVIGFDLAARNNPALQVGGDYYDVLTATTAGQPAGYLACVADVSGKGVAASLLMSNIQAILRALFQPNQNFPNLIARTNDLIHQTTPSNKYVTAIFVMIDGNGHCRYINAGHNQGIILRKDGSLDFLKTSGLPIGLMATRAPYPERDFDLEPGEMVAIFSDGVPEANDINEEEFGEDALIRCLKEHANEPAQAIVDRVFEEVMSFAGNAPQFDDITMMILKREAS